MGVKPDHWISDMASRGMIDPFQESQVSQGTISFGVSSYGYDFRLADQYKMPGELDGIVDPKQPSSQHFTDLEGESCVIEAGSFILGRSLEYFRIPRDILTLCSGKSTYARCGILVNVTPFEPEWEGYVTVSISNTSPRPVKLYSGEGVAQLVFLAADGVCRVSYADRKGKYQTQKGIELSRTK